MTRYRKCECGSDTFKITAGLKLIVCAQCNDTLDRVDNDVAHKFSQSEWADFWVCVHDRILYLEHQIASEPDNLMKAALRERIEITEQLLKRIDGIVVSEHEKRGGRPPRKSERA